MQHDLDSKTTDDISDDDLYQDPDSLTVAEIEDLEMADQGTPPITYEGRDFDVAGLVRRMKDGTLIVPAFGHDDEELVTAGFQRAFVWTRPQMDKFIESILLDYPIPEIFLIRQPDKRYLVLDGQQRLRTLQFFKEGVYDTREFSLANVAEELQGLTYAKLTDSQLRLFEGTFVQATILTSDGSANSRSSIYSIFERLNSGGTKLTPHEIRVALYAGPLVLQLTSLNDDSGWRHLYGSHNRRLRDHELVLRIVALYSSEDTYRRPLKKFLNDFLEQIVTDNPKGPSLPTEAGRLFRTAAALISESAGRDALRFGSTQVNAALTEAVFVGLMHRLATSKAPTADAVHAAISTLKSTKRFEASIVRSTADEQMVQSRLSISRKHFSEC